jgi:hypothetical protein
MTAMTGAERSKKLRDEEKAKGIQKLVLKLTATERGWIQDGQDIGGFEDPTEFLLEATKLYIRENSKEV